MHPSVCIPHHVGNSAWTTLKLLSPNFQIFPGNKHFCSAIKTIIGCKILEGGNFKHSGFASDWQTKIIGSKVFDKFDMSGDNLWYTSPEADGR